MLTSREEAPSVYEILHPLIRRWKLLFGGVAVGVLLAAGVSYLLPREYQTSFVLKIGFAAEKQLEDAQSVAEMINSESFQQEAARKAGLPLTGEQLRDMVKASTNPENWQNPAWVTVQVSANDPQLAVNVANAIGQAVVDRHAELFKQSMKPFEDFQAQMQKSIALSEEEAEKLKSNLQQYRATSGRSAADEILLQAKLTEHESQILEMRKELHEVQTSMSGVRSINTALTAHPILPRHASKPNVKMNLVVAAFAGFFLMISFILLSEQYKKGSLGL